MTPKVTIVMMVHNNGATLASAMRSVLTQTFDDLELFACIDGSTDGSMDIVRALAAEDRRVRWISHAHRGVGGTWDVCIGELRGRYFGIVDSDDLLLPTAVEETVARLDADAHIGLVYTDAIVIDGDGRALGYDARSRTPFDDLKLLTELTSFHFRLVRTELVKAAGIGGRHGPAFDYDMCLRIAEYARFEHLAVPLYLYRVHTNMASRSQRRTQIEGAWAAVNEALVRRGLDRDHRLRLQLRLDHLLERREGA